MHKDVKKELLSAALTLSLLLTGCGNSKVKKEVGSGNSLYTSKVVYSTESISGSISATNMEYVKILTFTVGESTFTKLVGIESDNYGNGYYNNKYIDLDTGTTLIDVITYKEGKSYNIGADLTIVSEERLLPLLYEAGIFKDEYDINEILSFYHENVEPNLEDNPKLALEK